MLQSIDEKKLFIVVAIPLAKLPQLYVVTNPYAISIAPCTAEPIVLPSNVQLKLAIKELIDVPINVPNLLKSNVVKNVYANVSPVFNACATVFPNVSAKSITLKKPFNVLASFEAISWALF